MNSVLTPIYNKENVTPTGGYTDRAWIGLYEELSNWTWVTGLNKTRLWYWLETGENNVFSSWQKGQPDNLSRGTRLMSSAKQNTLCSAMEVGTNKTFSFVLKLKLDARNDVLKCCITHRLEDVSIHMYKG